MFDDSGMSSWRTRDIKRRYAPGYDVHSGVKYSWKVRSWLCLRDRALDFESCSTWVTREPKRACHGDIETGGWSEQTMVTATFKILAVSSKCNA